MRHNASPWSVVIDDGRVDPAWLHQTHLLHWLDDLLRDPLGDGVHLPLGVQLLIALSSPLVLTTIGVALTKEVFHPERSGLKI